jgi:hypothetical protein
MSFCFVHVCYCQLRFSMSLCMACILAQANNQLLALRILQITQQPSHKFLDVNDKTNYFQSHLRQLSADGGER